MHVAIIGAGFAGLALAFHLLQKKVKVTLFDAQEIAQGGASSIASGLMHPYPGEQARRSLHAEEALLATRQLLECARAFQGDPIADFSGIIRYALNASQKEHLIKRTRTYADIEQIEENAFLIHSGVTIYPKRYLEGLWRACQSEGALFFQTAVASLSELKGYDQIVLSCGAALFHFSEAQSLPLKQVKGQILRCQMPSGLLKKSIVGKGYVALGENSDICYVGATFEREFKDALPHQEETKADLFPKIALFFKEVDQLNVLSCKAAIRVTREGSYLPLIQKIEDKTWVFTALGSRGLLYHALFAKQLSELILT